LAAWGLASRRACEQLILDRRVSVNGEVITSIPAFVDPEADKIEVDGRRVKYQPKVYLILNKPKGVLCTVRDPSGRKTVIDIIGQSGLRVFPVGRLDKDSQGLVLLTNDGELTSRLTHPRYQVERVYLAEVAGSIDAEVVDRLLKGVWLAEGKARAKWAKVVRRGPQRSVIQITLTEGKNRQVRRMLAKLGLRVRKLDRVRFGPLTLTGVKPERFRPLTHAELRKLKKLVKSG